MSIQIGSKEIVLVCGQTQTGKSNYAKYLVKQFLLRKCKVFVYDTDKEYKKLSFPNPDLLTIYEPKTFGQEEFIQVINELYKQGNIIVVLEEIELYVKAGWSIPDDIKRFFVAHAHRGLGIVMTTRRIADMHKLPAGLARHVIIFMLYLPQDVEYLAKFVGKTLAESSRELAPYHFLYYHHGKATRYQPIPKVS